MGQKALFGFYPKVLLLQLLWSKFCPLSMSILRLGQKRQFWITA